MDTPFDWFLHFFFFHFISRVIEYGDTYTFEVFFPHMHTEGTYDVSGQVLLLPIRGTGRFLGNFSEWNCLTRITWRVRLRLTHEIVPFLFLNLKQLTVPETFVFSLRENKRAAGKRFKLNDSKSKSKWAKVRWNCSICSTATKYWVSHCTMHISDLFWYHYFLWHFHRPVWFCLSAGDAVNSVINQNFDVVSKDIIPLVEKALQRKLKLIATKITQNFSYDQVFPL